MAAGVNHDWQNPLYLHNGMRLWEDDAGNIRIKTTSPTNATDGDVVIAQTYPGVHPGINLLRNPSFEIDADGVTPPTGWGSGGMEGCEVDDAKAFDGSKSVKVNFGVITNSCYIVPPALKKGQYVQVSVMCWASEANKACIWFIANGVISYSAYHSGGSDWELLSITYKLTADEATPVLSMYNNAGASAPAWYDQAVFLVSDTEFCSTTFISCERVDVTRPNPSVANPPAVGNEDGFPTLDFDKTTEESTFLMWRLSDLYYTSGVVRI